MGRRSDDPPDNPRRSEAERLATRLGRILDRSAPSSRTSPPGSSGRRRRFAAIRASTTGAFWSATCCAKKCLQREPCSLNEALIVINGRPARWTARAT